MKILLNSILEYAVNSGLIPRNPVKVVYVEKHERITGQALTKEEEAELLEVLKGRKIELCYILALIRARAVARFALLNSIWKRTRSRLKTEN